ncbi:MAG: large subunit ribosomal protein [Solirubrobacteraceae bacterium]|nr:large subunit ribosomal protein [Solirubrobacteraceae bacterium]
MGRTYEETGLVRAHAKWVRTSARKARVVLEHVRGLPVADARVQLRFATRHAADDILRVLESAIANAVNNHGLEEESLVVAEAFADEGVTMKRWQPRARGRAMRIRKRTAHITILLRAAEAPTASKAAAAAEPASKTKRTRGKKAAASAAPAEAAVVEAEAPVVTTPEAELAVLEAPDVAESEAADKPKAAKPKAAKPRAAKPKAAKPKADAAAEAPADEAVAEDHPEGEEA